MPASRVPETIDAIVTKLKAAGVKTWDGPVITGDYQDAVYVGYDANPDGEFRSVVGTQTWAGLGAKRRSEIFSVTCAAVALVGQDDSKASRDAVYALLNTVDTTLRADPSLGLAPPLVAGVKPTELICEPTSEGYMARLVFTIDVEIARV
jgi:hypothetical protein